MKTNPYQSPQGSPEPPRKQRAMTMALLSALAIPSAAIAGGATCAGTMMLTDWFYVAIPVGWLAIIVVLLIANNLYRPVKNLRSLWGLWVILALAVASPVAIIFAVMFGAEAFRLNSQGGYATPFWIAAVALPFITWSLACWIGLHGWEFWKADEPDEAKEPKTEH